MRGFLAIAAVLAVFVFAVTAVQMLTAKTRHHPRALSVLKECHRPFEVCDCWVADSLARQPGETDAQFQERLEVVAPVYFVALSNGDIVCLEPAR